MRARRTGIRRHAACAAALLSLAGLLAACTQRTEGGFQGYVEGDYQYVAPSIGGRLDHLSVRRGDTIAAGVPLFALEAEDETELERQAGGQLNAALAQLQDLKSGKRPVELDVVRAQLAQATTARQRSAKQLERDEEQFSIGAISQQQLDDSRAADSSNAERVRELGSQLESARLPARGDQVRAQSAQVAAARAALAQAAWRRAQKSVASTQAGFVVDTLFREGEWVAAGSPVVEVLPPGNVKVRFFVPEDVIGALKPGARLRIRCDGCPASVEATITYVATESEYTPPVIYSNDTRGKLVFMVEGHPAPEAASSLHPGQPVAVVLE